MPRKHLKADPAQPSEVDTLVTVAAIARHFGVHRRTVVDWIETAYFPAERDAAGRWVVDRETAEAWRRRSPAEWRQLHRRGHRAVV